MRVAYQIEKESKQDFERMALRAGVSASVFLEEVTDHLKTELTDRGVPYWMPQPEPQDGELPIEST